jgi:hypothetical protein
MSLETGLQANCYYEVVGYGKVLQWFGVAEESISVTKDKMNLAVEPERNQPDPALVAALRLQLPNEGAHRPSAALCEWLSAQCLVGSMALWCSRVASQPN